MSLTRVHGSFPVASVLLVRRAMRRMPFWPARKVSLPSFRACTEEKDTVPIRATGRFAEIRVELVEPSSVSAFAADRPWTSYPVGGVTVRLASLIEGFGAVLVVVQAACVLVIAPMIRTAPYLAPSSSEFEAAPLETSPPRATGIRSTSLVPMAS